MKRGSSGSLDKVFIVIVVKEAATVIMFFAEMNRIEKIDPNTQC